MQLVWILKNTFENTHAFSRVKERDFMSFLSEYYKQLSYSPIALPESHRTLHMLFRLQHTPLRGISTFFFFFFSAVRQTEMEEVLVIW